jgi:hypothetical protein
MSLFEQIEKLEKWLPVVDYEGYYEVSNWGRLRSIARLGTYGGILSCSINASGYPHQILCREGTRKSYNIHTLVARAFIGPRPPGMEIDHKDRDRTNNMATNLRYIIPIENHQRREDAPLRKEDVLEIRRLAREGFNHWFIAKQFGVVRQTVSRIVSYERWINV